MKVRFDFVTNSSSASYVITCAEIINKDELIQYLKDEYGRVAEKTIDNYFVKGSRVLEEKSSLKYCDFLYVKDDDFDQIDPDKDYIYVYEDIEGGNIPASIAYEIGHCRFAKNLFSGSWSGFDG